MKNRITLIVEVNDGLLWGRVEDVGEFMPTGQGETIETLIDNVKESIQDYIAHEGKADKTWKKIDLNKLEFDII